jgi:hypothetical protein
MKLFHLTESKNLNSILKYGLLPFKILNENHYEDFKKYGLIENKCIYTWDSEHYNNSKFIKDFIYCKFFIHPRNKLYSCVDHEIDFSKYGKRLYNFFPSFVLLEIDYENNKNVFLDKTWIHVQEPDDSEFHTLHYMDEKYSHDNKTIYIAKHKINNVKPIEEIFVRIYKHDNLGFTFRKYKHD